MKNYDWPPLILPDGDRRFRSLEINAKGELIYEQTDMGANTARLAPNGGDRDYECWLTIDSDAVEDVLIRLMRERFKNQMILKNWLDKHSIDYDFMTY